MRKSNFFVLSASFFYFVSGFTSLIFQVVLNKYFSFIFGVSAYATATVLAAFMLGLAVGSYWIGRKVTYSKGKLFTLYGLLEAAVGLYAICFIPISNEIDAIFSHLATEFSWSFHGLTLLRFVSAVLLIGIPTFLMGGTLPCLIEALRRLNVAGKINFVYGFNILGAAMGVIVGSYFLIPAIALTGALQVVLALNILLVPLSFLVQKRADRLVADRPTETSQVVATSQKIPLIMWIAAFGSGFIAFGNEVYWNHLLSLVIGTSVYAYAIMLFTTLIGMTAGSFLAHRMTKWATPPEKLLEYSCIMLAFCLVGTMPLWDKMPLLFLRLGTYVEGFAMRETLRFIACLLLILPAAICAGMILPLVFNALENKGRLGGHDLGRLYAVNTLGTILGSLIAGFIILESIGGRQAIVLNAIFASSLMIAFAASAREKKFALPSMQFAALILLGTMLPPWDTKAMLSGANIYFEKAHDDFDELVWQKENHVGGVTSIIRKDQTLTMLTNGKFQGNNGKEKIDQIRFAVIPNMFVKKTDAALNIGLGTGMTLGVIGEFPYKKLDAAELSPDIIEAARRYFSDINFNVLDRPGTHIHVEDGRNFLSLLPKDRRYDLISIELTSIWFAGAGNLYNDEFYQLAKKHMSQGAVMQQWLQLHHIGIRDIGILLKTLRKNFKYVQLWLPSHQGIIIASDEPLKVNPARVNEFKNSQVSHTAYLEEVHTLWGELLLNSTELDTFLADLEKSEPLPLSTDKNLFLEFSTPKGNTLGWNFDDNFSKLLKYSKGQNEEILPDEWQNDMNILAFSMLGRAQFYPKYSSAWHQAIQNSLEAFPNSQAKERVASKIRSTIL
ncbi:fused MFS/spermidine synthase [Oligoflexus tunisiensis]|uniref:fused MFS/spermidine synthase n=1 Tax=Oligoflexus tunisiensis TaxID=708132 RepID=UPI00114D0BFE|nr:fused MFS/spermidine synthase [Oligoflexus tunisiensis]